MKTLIHQRMLDISNTAAASLDGDVLGSLTEEDVWNDDYQLITDELLVYQDNIDLSYIYCITKNDDGDFVFSVDPTIDDQGEFGEPVVRTKALEKAFAGQAAVDDEPYQDRWGRFYSAYSPVFDKNGKIAGVVAVDFDADWYDAQIRSAVLTVVLSSVLSLIIGAVSVLLITYRIRKRFRLVNTELTDLSAEVGKLTSELELSQDSEQDAEPSATESEKGKKKAIDIDMLEKGIRTNRDELFRYINHLNTKERNMIAALASDYRGVYYVNLDKDEGLCFRSLYDNDESLREGDTFTFSKAFRRYAKKYVKKEYRDEFIRVFNRDGILKELGNGNVMTFHYLASRNGQKPMR